MKIISFWSILIIILFVPGTGLWVSAKLYSAGLYFAALYSAGRKIICYDTNYEGWKFSINDIYLEKLNVILLEKCLLLSFPPCVASPLLPLSQVDSMLQLLRIAPTAVLVKMMNLREAGPKEPEQWNVTLKKYIHLRLPPYPRQT